MSIFSAILARRRSQLRAQAGVGAKARPQAQRARAGVGARAKAPPPARARAGAGVAAAPAPVRAGIGAQARGSQGTRAVPVAGPRVPSRVDVERGRRRARTEQRLAYKQMTRAQRRSVIRGAVRDVKAGKHLSPAQRVAVRQHLKVVARQQRVQGVNAIPGIQVAAAASEPARAGVGAASRKSRRVSGTVGAGSGGLIPVATAVNRELTGTGLLARGGAALGRGGLGKTLGTAVAYGSPTGAVAVPAKILASAGVPQVGKAAKAVEGLTRAGVRDTFDLPANALPSAYVPVSAGYQYVRGNTKPASDLWKQLKTKDPIVLAGQGKVGKAIKATAQHPVYTALELRGVKAGLGRGTGGVMRSGALGKGAKRAAATTRPARVLEGTRMAQQQEFSPDVLNKLVQVKRQKRGIRQAGKLEQRAKTVEKANPDLAEQLRERAYWKRPNRRISDSEMIRQTHEVNALNEDMRRFERGDARAGGAVVRPAGKRTAARSGREVVSRKEAKARRVGGNLISPVAQGIVAPTREDVGVYLKSLEVEGRRLTGSKLRANKATRKVLAKQLKDPKLDLAAVSRAATAYRKALQPRENELFGTGMIDKDRADAARLLVVAGKPVERGGLGAQWDPTLRSMIVSKGTPEQLARVRKLHGEVAAARTAVKRAAGSEPFEAKPAALKRLRDAVAARKALTDRIGYREVTLDDMRRLVKRDPELVAERERIVQALPNLARFERQAAEARATTAPENLGAMARSTGDVALAKKRIAEIDRELAAQEPAFVSQLPGGLGARAFFQSFYPRKGLVSQQRTGEAAKAGTFDTDPSTLEAQVAHTQGMVSADRGFKRWISRFGKRDAAGQIEQYDNKNLATDAARNQTIDAEGRKIPGAVEWQPVPMNPWGGSGQALVNLLNDVNAAANPKQVLDALEQAFNPDASGPGPGGRWTIVPAPVAKEQYQFTRTLGASAGNKVLQVLSQAFSRTVLATSTKWLAGNLIEGELRAFIRGARPWTDTKLFRRVAKKIEETHGLEARREFESQVIAGGKVAMVERQQTYHGAEQFANTKVAPLARAVGTFMRAPGPKQLAGVWGLWTDFVFNDVNKTLVESRPQARIAGKFIRKNLIDPELRKIGETAIEQAARGSVDPNVAAAMGRYVDRAYGRYGKYGPSTRRLIALYTPFVAWAVNAVNFLFNVLPRDHPVLTGLLASAANVSEEWRQQHGLAKFLDNAAPGWLQGSIPVAGGGKLRLSRYTPFGVASDPLDTAASQVLPQFSGVIAAARGQDWKGKPLRDKNGNQLGDFGKVAYAAQQFVGSTVPLTRQTQSIATGQGPIGGRLRKEFDPFVPVKPKPKKGRGGGGPVDWSKVEPAGGGGVDWSKVQVGGGP